MARQKTTCTIDGCSKEHAARGLCDMHYRRLKKHGDPQKKLHVNKVPICLHDGCMKDTWAKNLCLNHYNMSLYYKNPEKVKVKNKRYKQNNREKVNAMARAFWKRHYEKNKGYYRTRDFNRNSRKRRSTPKWLTAAHKWVINQFYLACAPGYEVDHIVPLNGKEVCGLHVPWNLQILDASSNRSKNNRFNFEEYRVQWLTAK